MMAEFYFYFGTSTYEFERPDIIADPGAKVSVGIKKYTVLIRGAENMKFILKQNDTLPVLEAQLLNADGTPINLDLCGVHFHMKALDGRKLINRPAEIVDAENGKVKVTWQEGDTDTAGICKCEFEIVFPDSTILTIPNDGYFLVKVVNEIA